jgi:hypothetical protein
MAKVVADGSGDLGGEKMFSYVFLGLGVIIGILGLVSAVFILLVPSRWQKMSDKFNAILFSKDRTTNGPRLIYGMTLISICTCILWFVFIIFKQTI